MVRRREVGPLRFFQGVSTNKAAMNTPEPRGSHAHPGAFIQTGTWAIYLPTSQVVVWAFDTNRSFVKH